MFGFLFVLTYLNGLFADRIDQLTTNDDIRNTWQDEYLEMCTEAHKYQPSIKFNLTCERIFNLALFQFINVEILSKNPGLIRIHKFGDKKMIQRMHETFESSSDIENQRVEGHQYSAGYRGRIADGLWLEHHDLAVKPLFKRLQQTLTLNPAIAENFLILKYNVFGHYAPHYDHLFPMHRSYDNGWFEFFGNRMATALFIVQTAQKGGGTVFPLLSLTIQPEQGDLLLWANADSNDGREEAALHAACPIEEGHKMAVSLWIRGNFKDQLECSMENERYDAEMLIKRKDWWPQLRFDSRPQIQLDYDSEDELWPVEEENDEENEYSVYED